MYRFHFAEDNTLKNLTTYLTTLKSKDIGDIIYVDVLLGMFVTDFYHRATCHQHELSLASMWP